MTEQSKGLNMVFDLSIRFDGIEVKGNHIVLKDFLNVSNQIANAIEPFCSYNMHVNFAETILSGLKICGEINSVFNHKSFSSSLIKLQEKMKTSWRGYYTYEDAKDKFIFHAPNFYTTTILD
tara:strand:+ start:190 stop:555 length:366 start_codon:yes stop_codon:yes gene_type:complete